MNFRCITLIAIIIGNFMPFSLNASQQPIKIRTLFNIKHAYCSIKTNGVKGLDNRKSAFAGRGGGISSTNALLFLENGENEISLEIGALAWFSKEKLNALQRKKFSDDSRCKLDLVEFSGNEKRTLLSINVKIDHEGIPYATEDGNENILITKTMAPQVESGHIDSDFFDPLYFPNNMELYHFSKTITLTGIPRWEWINATPFTGGDEQLNGLRLAYKELAGIINSNDRTKLKINHQIVLKAWSAATGDTEDQIFESQYPSSINGTFNIKIDPIDWSDYSVRAMNKGRLLQLYNISKPTYSPLTYHYKDENGDEHIGSIAPIFSLIKGKFIPVL